MGLMYHVGKKAAAYITVLDPSLPNGKIELETRQCSHCNTQWIYIPGSKRKYGVCMVCLGYTCMKKECNIKCEPFEARLDRFEKGVNIGL